MKALDGMWQGEYLNDSLQSTHETRITVLLWMTVAPINDQYVSYQKDWRVVWNYLLEIGWRAVFEKVKSRIQEEKRNRKYLSIGLGRIKEINNKDSKFRQGDLVVFFAYNHPLCSDCVVIHENFLRPWIYELPFEEKNEVKFFDRPIIDIASTLTRYQGWSTFSEIPVNKAEVQIALKEAADQVYRILGDGGRFTPVLRLKSQATIRERKELENNTRRSREGELQAVLFGLGNYAKTALLPYLDKRIRVACIHEVDPTQLGALERWKDVALDTSGFPRDNEHYDVYFIAGFHHTHAPIAIHALKQGAYAAVEKPLVTTRSQLDGVREALEQSGQGLFSCFHKRYSPLNNLAWSDLKAARGDPINYHCIVYEIPLPKRHWYNWPASGSRIISNGCHWIDHFLYFNAYAPVLQQHVIEAGNGDIVVFVELENGAVFTLTLSAVGSKRIGVRDYIELRHGDVTVRMIDGGRYESEDNRRVLRRKRFNKVGSYALMYRTISRRIVAGECGDSLESLRSSELMIDLEEELQSIRKGRIGAVASLREIAGARTAFLQRVPEGYEKECR